MNRGHGGRPGVTPGARSVGAGRHGQLNPTERSAAWSEVSNPALV
jgi:hypothetical protein